MDQIDLSTESRPIAWPTTTPPLVSLGRRVIATPIMTPTRRGHIFMPYVKNTQEAIVVHPGEFTNLSAGDRILYRPYNIKGFDYCGEHYLVLTENELLAKLEFEDEKPCVN